MDQDKIILKHFNGRYLIHTENTISNDGINEQDSSVSDAVDPLEGFDDAITINEQHEKPSFRRPKYNLKMILSYSSKYIKSFNKFGERLYDSDNSRTLKTDKSNSFDLCDDKLLDMINDYPISECKLKISLSDGVIKQIKHLNYLPKIKQQSQDDDLLSNENSNRQKKLVQWNQINETNLRCILWLKDYQKK